MLKRLLVVSCCLLLISIAWFSVQGFLYGVHDKSRLLSCSSKLHDIGRAYSFYVQDYDNTPPPKLEALNAYVRYSDWTLCPAGSPGESYDPPLKLPQSRYRYVYSQPQGEAGTWIIWDQTPHLIRGAFKSTQLVNALRSDDTVTVFDMKSWAKALQATRKKGDP